MFRSDSPQPRRRGRRGAAALLAGVLATACLNLVGFTRPASAASLCDIRPDHCQPLPTFNHNPYGGLDAPTFGPASVTVSGWATDIDASGPIGVVVTIDGTVVGSGTASVSRPNVGNSGFSVTVPASPASAQVCVMAVNVGLGSDASLGCAPFPYSTNVSLLDQCGGAVGLPRSATKWALMPPPIGQVAVETTAANAGRVGFMSGPSVPGFPVGMSVSDGVSAGPLFRSGPMGALPAGSPGNPSGRLNLVVPCPTGFTVAQLNALVSSFPVPLPAGVTTGTPTLTTGSGTVTLSVSGTATGTVGFVPYREPFTYSLTFRITPSMNMSNPAEIVLVTPTGPGTLTFTGNLGWLLNPTLAPNLQPTVTSSVVSGAQSAVNGLIASTAAAAGAPAGSTISMARVVITPSGASLTPVVGWFG